MLCTAISRCTRIAGQGGNETTDYAGLTRAITLSQLHAHATDFFCKVKTGTAMAGPAVVAPTALQEINTAANLSYT